MNTIKARDSVKQKLFDVARNNYIKMSESIGDTIPPPALKKITLVGKTKEILQKGMTNQAPRVRFHKGFFDYSKQNDGNPRMWVSFANKSLGGGFLGTGYVQEEILTVEFYEMALMIVEQHVPVMKLNEAYVFLNLIRSSISDPNAYMKYTKATLEYPSDVKVANFLAIDAPRRGKDPNEPYKDYEINHLCVKSLVGFLGCVELGYKEIHTGNWGAGVFHNRRDVVYFIQYLSAWLAGIEEIHFWAYSSVDVQFIVDLMENPGDIEDYFLDGMEMIGFTKADMTTLYNFQL